MAQGIVLEHALKGTRSVTPVEVTRDLKPGDSYDLVLVVMRRNQVADVLPALAANRRTPLVAFMVNNPLGYAEWLNAVGRERLLVGFAGAGGTRVEGVVYYHVVSGLLQPTTFGEPEGGVTERVEAVARVFKRAGFPTAVCSNMDAWQKTHVAWSGEGGGCPGWAGEPGPQLQRRFSIPASGRRHEPAPHRARAAVLSRVALIVPLLQARWGLEGGVGG